MATTTTPPTAGSPRPGGPTSEGARPVRRIRRQAPGIVRFYSTAVGKKWVMAITGVALMVYVLVHMVGNLKLFLSREEINLYGEALRDLGGDLVPRTSILWLFRSALIAAFVFHIHAAISLTVINRKARPERYHSRRDYVAADYAARTMRWTGVIIALFVVFHLMDLTWGNANPDFTRGDPYNNLVASFERVPVAIFYIVANVALALHLFHGAWSIFQSMGLNNPKYNGARRVFAQAFAIVILAGNLTFPVAVQLGLVEQACPEIDPTAECPEESGL